MKTKFYFSILISLFFSGYQVTAQTPTVQDCLGAIPITSSVYHEVNAYSGTGNYTGEINSLMSCLQLGEKNDVWYSFSTTGTGNWGFYLTPNVATDDYDWAVFDITGAACADIATNASLEVACNYSGVPGVTGPDGLTGPQNSPLFQVIAGHNYVINVSQFSTSVNGYTITFINSALMALPAQTLAWQWGKSAGGSDYEYCSQIIPDGNGNTYTTGNFTSDTLVFGSSVLINTDTANNAGDLFIVKYDSLGNVVWAKSAGGVAGDNSVGIGHDAAGNLYTAGTSNSDTIIFGTTSYVNNLGFYIAKYDTSGNVIWIKGNNGSSSHGVYLAGIAVDANGNSYVTGYFGAHLLILDADTLVNADSTGYDVFIAKYDNQGNVVWAKRAGGYETEESTGIALDQNGYLYLTGWFEGTYMLFGGNYVNNPYPPRSEAFIAKYDVSGNVIWAKSGGGQYDEAPQSIAVDAIGNCWISGYFASPTATFGSNVLTCSGIFNVFNIKYDPQGNALWAKSGGGTYFDFGYGVAADQTGNSYITGSFSGVAADFDTITLTNSDTTGNSSDMFIAKYDASGNIVWAISTASTSEGLSVATDNNDDLYLVGRFTDIITLGNITLTNQNGGDDFFIAKYGHSIPNTNCSAIFTLYPDTAPHNWFALNQATGTGPLSYTWSWGDGNTSIGVTPSHTYAAAGYYNICLTITDSIGCTSTYCDSSTYIYKGTSNSIITINVVNQLPTGMDDIDVNSLASIYPNPATNHLTVTLPGISQKVNIVITDITGKTIYNIADATTEKLEVNTKDFSNGVYFVQIQTADFVETKKLIIQK